MTLPAYPHADVITHQQNGPNAKVAVVDQDGTIVSVNEAWRLSAVENGYIAEGHGVGVNYLKLCDLADGPDADYAHQAAMAVRSVLSGDIGIQTFEYVCASVDQEQWAMFVASPLPSNWSSGAVIAHVDITTTKDVGQVLKRSEERLRQQLNALPILIAYLDKNQRYQLNNDAYEAWFGVSNGELLGKRIPDVIGEVAYRDLCPHIEACLSGKAVEFEMPLSAGRHQSVYVRGNYVPDVDASGVVRGMFAFVQDITKERALAVRVEHQSMHDALTGLPNRSQLQQRVKSLAALEAGREAYGSLMILDLDHFKDINDTLGHFLGDKLLCAVARRLIETTTEHDIVARLGGDEFAVVRSAAAIGSSCPSWAKRMIEQLEAPFLIEGHELHISASIGIAPFRGRIDDFGQLLKQADLALYSAKAGGRGRCCVFADKMWTDLMRRQRMLQSLREAINTDQMSIHYQPQVDLKTGALNSVEALARWCHPTCGEIEPKTFIPVAESSGLIGTLGAWIMHKAAREAMDWQEAGHRFTVSVNVSPMQIKQPAFLDQVRQVIDLGVQPGWLEFEITEAVLVETDRRDSRVLQEVVDLGIHLAIDDFGSGYSSLAYLKRLPVDKIKIEQSFVRDIGVDSDDEAIIKAIITLGHALGKRVVAEGVETKAQAAFLRDHGCDDAQGFYFARPLCKDGLDGWLDQSQWRSMGGTR